MTNSALATITKLSPNKTSPRNHAIDTITIHCMQGQLSAASCGAIFENPKRQASSNYGVGKSGDIGLYVKESDRSWCTSSKANDHRAITIEVASDKTAPYKVTEAAYNALLNLVTDICRRNNIKKLVWSTDKKTRINHWNGANMTVHRDFAAKACPGDYLYNRMGEIADEVNRRLGQNVAPQTGVSPYTVQITANVLNVRKGPGTSYGIVTTVKKGQLYTITEEKANGSTRWGHLLGDVGWISLGYTKKV